MAMQDSLQLLVLTRPTCCSALALQYTPVRTFPGPSFGTATAAAGVRLEPAAALAPAAAVAD
jgi:hypothetical protein